MKKNWLLKNLLVDGTETSQSQHKQPQNSPKLICSATWRFHGSESISADEQLKKDIENEKSQNICPLVALLQHPGSRMQCMAWTLESDVSQKLRFTFQLKIYQETNEERWDYYSNTSLGQ